MDTELAGERLMLAGTGKGTDLALLAPQPTRAAVKRRRIITSTTETDLPMHPPPDGPPRAEYALYWKISSVEAANHLSKLRCLRSVRAVRRNPERSEGSSRPVSRSKSRCRSPEQRQGLPPLEPVSAQEPTQDQFTLPVRCNQVRLTMCDASCYSY